MSGVPPDEKERVRTIFDKLAPKYDRNMGVSERIFLGGAREWACARATGDVLEIGIGTGLNLALYPPGARVTGIEYSAAMLELAKRRAGELGVAADLRLGDAERLLFDDASFDTVVSTYSLCTIPDDRQAAREAKRVLRPDGRLILAEHVRSPTTVVRVGQRLIDPLMHRIEGDNLLRDPLDYISEEGFTVEEVERSRVGIVECLVARKPKQEEEAKP